MLGSLDAYLLQEGLFTVVLQREASCRGQGSVLSFAVVFERDAFCRYTGLIEQ